MNAYTYMFRSVRHQNGFVSIIVAIVLVAAIIFILNQSLGIITNTTNANQSQKDSTAAFFLAESGVERAQATIKKALDVGTYNATYCTTATNWPEQSLGVGKKFEYTPIPYCTGTGCTECNVTVKGTANSAARTIRAKITTVTTQGTAVCGSKPSLTITATADNSAVFTNLTYRSKAPNPPLCQGQTSGGANAKVGYCFNTGLNDAGGASGNCVPATDGWDLKRPGTNNVSGMGVYSLVDKAASNVYTISQELWSDNINATTLDQVIRDYVEVGVLFAPTAASGKVTLAGSYGLEGNTTGTSSNPTGTVPSTWLCGATNGTGTAARAASANTLVFGFSSWPADSTKILNHVTLGAQPFRRQINMQNDLADRLYSQIWYTYNSSYYPGDAATASNGGIFTATIGAPTKFKASTTPAGGSCTVTSPAMCLVLEENLSGGQILSTGDTITGSNCDGTPTCTLGEYISGAPRNQSGALYALTYANGAAPSISSKDLTASSRVLNPISPPSGGLLPGDAISVGTASPLGFIQGSSPYTLVDGSGTSIAQLQVASSDFRNSGKVITLSGVTVPGGITAKPDIGTAVGVHSPTGITFGSTTVTGQIVPIPNTTNSTLTVTSGSPLNVDDALFGSNVKPNTRILSASHPTYTVTNVQMAPTGSTVVARAAVKSVVESGIGTGTIKVTVSRLPTSTLINASLCGGLCAFLKDGSGTTFTLSNLTSGDDWASGFACLSGVDPDSIKTLGTVGTKRTGWTEVVNQ